jgi:hypothetical protein
VIYRLGNALRARRAPRPHRPLVLVGQPGGGRAGVLGALLRGCGACGGVPRAPRGGALRPGPPGREPAPAGRGRPAPGPPRRDRARGAPRPGPGSPLMAENPTICR